jgi:hypothetical protein
MPAQLRLRTGNGLAATVFAVLLFAGFAAMELFV